MAKDVPNNVRYTPEYMNLKGLKKIEKRERKAKKIAPTLPLKVRRKIFKAACRNLKDVMGTSFRANDTATLIKLAKILRL